MLIEFVTCFSLFCYCLSLADLEQFTETENCPVIKFQRNPKELTQKASLGLNFCWIFELMNIT